MQDCDSLYSMLQEDSQIIYCSCVAQQEKVTKGGMLFYNILLLWKTNDYILALNTHYLSMKVF